MKIEDKGKYILITSDENSFSDFFAKFEKKHHDYFKNHIIVKIYRKFNIAVKDILLFLECAEKHRHNNSSFIIVLKDIDVDDIPESLNIVPSLQEAEDVLEMEDIQRDLGF